MANQLYDADHLYALLPEVYRQRDGKDPAAGAAGAAGPAGSPRRPLYDLISLLAREARVLARDIERMHENSFVETADDWAVPYLGDLLGVRGLRAGRAVSPRAEVANTLGYRRRKGGAAVLEQLARDVTGWPARVVEPFQLLAWSQWIRNHVRRDAAAFADLRAADRLELVGGPFASAARTVDVRRSPPRQGRHKPDQVILFLCRLEALPQLLTTPRPGPGPGTFTFSTLGHDAPLFTHPLGETGIASIAEEIHLPLPIRRRALRADLAAGGGNYLGANRSIAVLVPDLSVPGPPRWDPLPAEYVSCELGDWSRPLPAPSGSLPLVAIDPALGRLRFAKAAEAPAEFRLSSYYGFSARLGGGQYDRSPLAGVTAVPAAQRLIVGAGPGEIDRLEDALAAPWSAGDGDRLIEIADSRTYEVPLAVLEIPEACRLVLRAADRQRPTLLLSAPELAIAGGRGSRCELDGLLIAGAPLRVAAPPPLPGEAASAGLEALEIRHCTLVPGLSLQPDGLPAHPGAVSLTIETGETEAKITLSILGGVRTAEETRCEIESVVLDVHDSGEDAFAGGILVVRGSTFFGGLRAAVIELAENSIFLGRAIADRRQLGCVRHCWVPLGSRVPRRFRCQPEVAPGLGPEAAKRLERALRPRFTSRRYGRPAYAQLDWRGPAEITRGADNGAEMGVLHHLEAALREDDLRLRLDEYLPAALEAGLFYST